MVPITFSAFANALRKHLSGGMGIADFTRFLFELVTDSDDLDDIGAGRTDRTFQSFFSGKQSIDSYVKDLRGHIQFTDFIQWLENADSSECEKLRKELSEYLPASATYDFPEACAKLFESILDDPDPKPQEAGEQGPEELPLQLTYETQTEDSLLRDECLNRCLMCNKRRKAYVKVKIAKASSNYQERAALRKAVEAIGGGVEVPDFEGGFDYSSNNNLALLCPSCAAEYESSPSQDKCARLMSNKLRAKRNHLMQQQIDAVPLDDGLRDLLDSLDSLIDPNDVAELRYSPVKVADKIRPEAHILKTEITDKVNRYYGFIREELGRREANGCFYADEVCESVKACYRRLSKTGASQDQVYDTMSRWLSEATGSENHAACRVLIAFFVQNCEVFDALSE